MSFPQSDHLQPDPHDLFLDLTITILDEQQEKLMKISCKLNKNILNLQIIKLFVQNILSKVHELIQNPTTTPAPSPVETPTQNPLDGKLEIELHDGKYENYLYYDSLHLLLLHHHDHQTSHSTEQHQHHSKTQETRWKYENNEHKISILCHTENAISSFLTNYQHYFHNFIFVIGSDENSLFLYDNWCLSETISIRDVIRIIEDRTAEYYLSNERSGNSFRSLHSTPSTPHATTTTRNDEVKNPSGGENNSFSFNFLQPSPSSSSPFLLQQQFQHRDELLEICESISLVMTPKNSLPKHILRISIQTFRSTNDSPSRHTPGKTFTIHHVLVRQDGYEWTIQYRYSDFARLHDQLLSQEETSPGFISRQNLPHLPSKKLFTASTSTSLLYIDRRRAKLGKYINSLIAIPGALDNHHIRTFLELNRHNSATPSPSSPLNGSLSMPHQRHPRNTIHVSKLNTEARWGDLILFKINPDTQSHLTHSSCWEWDHVGLVVLSQSEFSHDQETEMIDDPNPSLDLLELTSEGVTLYPLTGRLRSYNYQNYVRYMGLRKLRGFPRKKEMASKLNEFVSSVLNSPTKSIGKNRKGQRDSSPKSFSLFPTFSDDYEIEPSSVHENYFPTSGVDSDSYLNAELIASALKVLGIIPKHFNPDYFWAGSFAQNDEIDNLTNDQIFNYAEELVLDCKVVEVNRAVERYSIRKAADQENDDIPDSLPMLNHLNSSQIPNLGIMNLSMDDEPNVGPMLQHYSSYGIPNVALGHNNQKSFPDLPGGVPLVALTEESSDEDDEEEVRKAAVRGMPKAQSLKELRLNSKHIVSQALDGENNLTVDPSVSQQVNDLLMNSPEDD